MVRKISATMIEGISIGTVICQNCCQREAPSTKGGPGEATETLAMLIHKTTIDYLDVGYGSTLAVSMFVLSMVITAFYLRRVGANAS